TASWWAARWSMRSTRAATPPASGWCATWRTRCGRRATPSDWRDENRTPGGVVLGRAALARHHPARRRDEHRPALDPADPVCPGPRDRGIGAARAADPLVQVFLSHADRSRRAGGIARRGTARGGIFGLGEHVPGRLGLAQEERPRRVGERGPRSNRDGGRLR